MTVRETTVKFFKTARKKGLSNEELSIVLGIKSKRLWDIETDSTPYVWEYSKIVDQLRKWGK
jgi:hypothetical protein